MAGERKRTLDPFPDRVDLQFRSRLEGWEVGYFCQIAKWTWRRCEAARKAQASKEAPAIAMALIRESADRWNKVANDALEKEIELRRFAMRIEHGLDSPGAGKGATNAR